MNKRCYKIIFSRSLQCLVVVSEWAKGNGKSDNRSGVVAGGTQSFIRAGSYVMRCLSAHILVGLGLASLSFSQVYAEGIVADNDVPKGQQAIILSTDSGVTQINIQSPTSGGVSINQYKQFDIGEKGAILANNRKATQTQIAGQVKSNPFMARGEADVIVNQVNSSRGSHLNGTLEVAGKRADVIIANPSGIGVNGGRILNANKVILSTGQTQIQSGKVTGHNISQGKISIEGTGLDVSDSDYAALLSRSAEINAIITKGSGQLDIITGVNYVDNLGKVTAKTELSSDSPQLSIDTGSLGGMYADSIRLVGTEKGVGVNNSGVIQATKLTLSADGTLSNSGELTAEQLNLKTKGLKNTGKLRQTGSQNLLVKALSLSNNGKFGVSEVKKAADKPTDIDKHVPSSHSLGTITVSGEIMNTGEINAVGEIDLELLNSFSNTGTLAVNSAKLSAGTFTNSGDVIIASAELEGASFLNTKGIVEIDKVKGFDFNQGIKNISGRVSFSDVLAVKTQSFSNLGDGSFSTDKPLSLSAAQVVNEGVLKSSGDLLITSNKLENKGGTISSDSKLSIHSDSLKNSLSGYLMGQSLDLSSKSTDNSGTISQTGLGELLINIARFSNLGFIGHSISKVSQGKVEGISQQSQKETSNQPGRINFGEFKNMGNLVSQGKTQLNISSWMSNWGNIEINSLSAKGTFDNTGKIGVNSANLSGVTFSNSGQLTATRINQFDYTRGISNSGELSSQGDFEIRTNAFGNSGKVNGSSSIRFVTNRWNNTGKIASENGLAINTEQLTNGGALFANKSLSITATEVNNSNSGSISSDVLSLKTVNFLNYGLFSQTGSGLLNIVTHYLINREEGLLGNTFALSPKVKRESVIQSRQSSQSANGSITVANVLENSGKIIAAGESTLGIDNGLSNAGTVNVKSITQSGGQFENSGYLLSNSQFLHVAEIDNHGVIAAAGKQSIKDAVITNYSGSQIQAEQMDWDILSMDNYGVIAHTGNGLLSIKAKDVNNTNTISTAEIPLDNLATSLVSQESLAQENKGKTAESTDNLSVQGTVNNHGEVISNSDISLTSEQSLSNKGRIKVARLTAQGKSLVNEHLINATTIDSTAATVTNNHEISGDTIKLNGNTLNNNGNKMTATTQLAVVMTDTANNANGILSSEGDLSVIGEKIVNQNGTIKATKSASVSAAGLVNNQGGLISGNTSTVKFETLNNSADGQIKGISETNLTGGKHLNNNGGSITANKVNINSLEQDKQYTLLVDNTSGKIDGQDVSVSAKTINGLNNIDVTRHYSLDVQDDFSAEQNISVSGDLSINTRGDFTNKVTLSGDKVNLSADGDIDVIASKVSSQTGTTLTAGGDVNLEATAETYYGQSSYQTTTTKPDGTKVETTTTTHTTSVTHKGATIETTGTGDTTIIAGGNYRQTGSAVTAANGDVLLDAEQMTVSSVNDHYSSQTTTVVKESGSFTTENTALSEIASELAEATALLGQSNVERINDLAQATVDYLTTKKEELEAAIAKQSGTEGGDAKTTTVRTIEKTTTTTSSNSQDTAKSSTITASGEVSVVASGDTNSSIRIIGSEVIGESGTYLTADGDIALLSAGQSQGSTNNREMSGVAFGVTQVADKVISAYSEAEVNNATAVSSGTTHHHSHIGSDNSQTTIKSGDKLTIKGTQVVGKGVKLDADDLHIESEQDTYTYSGSESSQKIMHLGDGENTAATAIKTKVSDYQVSANYASVNQQSGVVADDAGFQVNIANHTTIKGGIITSNAQSQAMGNNQFSTGTLSVSDINNHSRYSASGSETVNHVQISGEYDKSYKDNGMGYGQTSGSNSSVTSAGIGTTAIRITDEAKQRGIQADVLSNPQTAQTNQTSFVAGGLANNFNADAVKREVKTQIAVTKTAGQWMPYEVAKYAEAQMARYEKVEEILAQIKPLLDKNLRPEDREKATSLVKQAEEITGDKAGNYDAWKEGGDKRVAMHAEVGYRLTGTEEGAKAAAIVAALAPKFAEIKAGLTEEQQKLFDLSIGIIIGEKFGGEVGRMAANIDWNNRQAEHAEISSIRDNAGDFADRETDRHDRDSLSSAMQATREYSGSDYRSATRESKDNDTLRTHRTESAERDLFAENMRGVSDDASNVVQNQHARDFLDSLPEAGTVTEDGQHLFGDLDRNSDEYKDSTINVESIAENLDLYNDIDLNNNTSVSNATYLLSGAARDVYNKEKEQIVNKEISEVIGSYYQQQNSLSPSDQEFIQLDYEMSSALPNIRVAARQSYVTDEEKRKAAQLWGGAALVLGGGGALALSSQGVTSIVLKEVGSEVASQATGGLTDVLSLSSVAKNIFKYGDDVANAAKALGKKNPVSEAVEKGIKDNAKKAEGAADAAKAATSEGKANAATAAKLADDLAKSMEKPNVSDTKLSNIMNDLYRKDATVGSGSTADALRYEKATGQPVGNKYHEQKAKDYSQALENWIDKNPDAKPTDISAAKNVLKDLNNAQEGK